MKHFPLMHIKWVISAVWASSVQSSWEAVSSLHDNKVHFTNNQHKYNQQLALHSAKTVFPCHLVFSLFLALLLVLLLLLFYYYFIIFFFFAYHRMQKASWIVSTFEFHYIPSSILAAKSIPQCSSFLLSDSSSEVGFGNCNSQVTSTSVLIFEKEPRSVSPSQWNVPFRISRARGNCSTS